MSYTFVSARFGAPDNHCVVAITEEVGAVVLSEADNPSDWLDLWSSGVIIEPYLPPALQERQENIWQLIQAERARRWHGGVQVGGYWFHSDLHSRSQWAGMKLLGVPDGVEWKTMSGEFVAMTPTLVDQVIGAMALNDAAVFTAAEIHRQAMQAEGIPELYDFSGGWPPTHGE